MSNNTTLAQDLPTRPVSGFLNTTMDSREIFNINHIQFSYADWVEHINFQKRLYLSSIIILVFIIIFTTLGNTTVLVTTWRERILHQPNKYFIACLAVADLFVGLFVAPSLLYICIVNYKLTENSLESSPQLNLHFCRFLVWMDTLSLTASIYTLTFISFDRYLKLSKPLQYKSRMTTSRSLKIIFVIWLISSCFATYAATPGSGSKGVLFVGGFCQLQVSRRFYTVLSISTFILPSIVILIMYTLIFIVAHKRRKMLRNGELGHTNNDENQRNTFLKDLKVIRMLLIVVGVFIVCWGPLFISFLLQYHDRTIVYDLSLGTIIAFYITGGLALLNSLCNPIIYASLDQTYKKAFKQLFQRMICHRSSNPLMLARALEQHQVRRIEQNV